MVNKFLALTKAENLATPSSTPSAATKIESGRTFQSLMA